MSRAKVANIRSPQEMWCFALLVLLPLLAYARLATAGFLWDDDTMLAANPLVLAGDGLRRIWFTTQAIDYWPVTYSSLWAEWRIWGPWAPGYHLTNVVLHVVEGVLLWRLLVRFKLPGAYFAALWFALHPLNVESVAWIAQRKNLLAMLFFLLSLRAFAESSVVESGRADRWCVLAWVGFLLALLSKGSTAPLPFVLLGCVIWHRRVRWKDGLWLGTFFLTAAIMVLVNIWFSHKSGGDVIRAIGWPERISGAGAAVWFYLGKIFWPIGLCFVYPRWTIPPSHPLWWLGLALAVAVSIGLWLGRKRGTKPELAAWFYFGAMLLPVLGLTDVYFMKFSLVADHYVHLALVGVLAWAAARFVQWKGSPAFAWGIAFALGLLTFQQTAIYQNNSTLFSSVLIRNPESWMAHSNLGYYLELSGHPSEAAAEYSAAIALRPDLPELHDNLGSAWSKLPGRLNDAIAQYEEALRLRPDYADAHRHLGSAWLRVPGHATDAIAQFQEMVRLTPEFADAHYDLGDAFMKVPERMPEAIAQFKEALRLKPNYAEAHNNLGGAWSNIPGRENDAIAEFEMALKLKPNYVEARYNLGNALMNTPGHVNDAIAQFEAALRLQPKVAALHLSLAIALLNAPGRANEAVSQLEIALQLEPQNEMARKILAQVRASPP
jgi:protein O-mannosyl-transferase